MTGTRRQPLDELHIPPSYFNRRVEGPRASEGLPSDDYSKLERFLDEEGALDPKDAERTKVNIAGIQRKWDK